ncbi:MAG TPA: hypothetical protein VME46_07375 [Acidimicrobiales bacterium]|nr:hypothetical protein [Acidimicrobiales bacterium]
MLRFVAMTPGGARTGYWPPPGGVPATGSKTVARTWSAPRLSGPDLYYLVGVVVGLTVFAIGVEQLLFPTRGLSEGPAAMFAAVGTFFVVVGTLCWRLPARRIELSSDGTLTFLSSRRRLEVQPGELRSVWRFPNDPRRLLPFLVAAKHGRMLLACRFDEMEGIQEALSAHSPHAQVAQLVPWSMRAHRRAPPAFLYRAMRTPASRPGRRGGPRDGGHPPGSSASAAQALGQLGHGGAPPPTAPRSVR